MELVYELYGVKCTAASTFGKVNRAFLFKSSQNYLTASGNKEEEVWKRCHLHGAVKRNELFIYKERREKQITMMMLLLFNLHARIVTMKQTSRHFMPNLFIDAKEQNLDARNVTI